MSSPTPLHLTIRQRDALYAATVADLPRIVDVVLALGRGEYALARLLRTRYEAELRLLDDLGWEPTAPADRDVELTTPRRQLAHALHHIGRLSHERLIDCFDNPVAYRDHDARAQAEHDKLVTEVCHDVLGQLAPPALALATAPAEEA